MTMIIVPQKGGGSGSGVAIYQNIADLPPTAPDGTVASVIEDQTLRQFDSNTNQWVIVGGPGVVFTGTDTDSIDVTVSSNVISADLLLSSNPADAGNLLIDLSIQSTGSKGLRAQLAESDIRGLFSASSPISYDDTTGVFSFASSPTFSGTVSATAFLAAEGDPSPLTGYGFTGDGDTGMYSSGDGAIEFYNNGFLRIEMDQGGFKTINGQPFKFPYSPGSNGQTLVMTDDSIGQLSWGIPSIIKDPDTLAYFDSSGELQSFNHYVINGVEGFNVNYSISVQDNASNSLNSSQYDFTPTEDSPATTWTINNIQATVRTSGFEFGTGGNALSINNYGIAHDGDGDTGTLEFNRYYFNLGNGTDPIKIRGFSYSMGFANINANVEINGPIQGYIFQPSFDSTVTMTAGSYANIFGDFVNAPIDVNGWSSFVSNPTFAGIQNNSNYVAFQANPQITSFLGNAGGFGFVLGGNWGTFTTGGFTGINLNANITSVQNAQGISIDQNIAACTNYTGLNINVSNVSSTNPAKAISTNGPIEINGTISGFKSLAPVNGGGQPNSGHQLITQLTQPASTTTAFADFIGVNTASLMSFGDNSTVTTALLGLTALGLPAVVSIGNGASVDKISGAVFALSFDAAQTGVGTLTEGIACYALAIPNATTVVDRFIGFKAEFPFGNVGTDNWGVYAKDYANSWFEDGVKIGGTAGSTDKVANTSIALEVEGKALRVKPMTQSARDALTPLEGMIVGNSDTNLLNYYTGSLWLAFGDSAFTATAPLNFDIPTQTLSISQATTSTNGYLSSTDWNTFNGKLSPTATNNGTNSSWIGSGQTPASASQNATNGQTSTGTFDRDIMQFTIYEATGRRSILCFADYASGVVTAVSDPSNIFLPSDSGTGIYVSKSASSNVISVKNRLGSTVTITIQAINSNITSATAWT